jgi:PadR family transcriptional regulator
MQPYVRILSMAHDQVSEVRLTLAVAQLLKVFLEDVAAPRYGYELMRLTGFASGKLYPILARMTRAGWLTREREDVVPAEEGRPARYIYRLTDRGTRAGRHELAALNEKIALPTQSMPRLRPAGGRA